MELTTPNGVSAKRVFARKDWLRLAWGAGLSSRGLQSMLLARCNFLVIEPMMSQLCSF